MGLLPSLCLTGILRENDRLNDEPAGLDLSRGDCGGEEPTGEYSSVLFEYIGGGLAHEVAFSFS